MVGRIWSAEEESCFWQTIMDMSPKRAAPYNNATHHPTWRSLAQKMAKKMGPEAPRAYTNNVLYEHYYLNVAQKRISPNAHPWLGRYLAKLKEKSIIQLGDPRNAERDTSGYTIRPRMAPVNAMMDGPHNNSVAGVASSVNNDAHHEADNSTGGSTSGQISGAQECAEDHVHDHIDDDDAVDDPIVDGTNASHSENDQEDDGQHSANPTAGSVSAQGGVCTGPTQADFGVQTAGADTARDAHATNPRYTDDDLNGAMFRVEPYPRGTHTRGSRSRAQHRVSRQGELAAVPGADQDEDDVAHVVNHRPRRVVSFSDDVAPQQDRLAHEDVHQGRGNENRGPLLQRQRERSPDRSRGQFHDIRNARNPPTYRPGQENCGRFSCGYPVPALSDYRVRDDYPRLGPLGYEYSRPMNLFDWHDAAENQGRYQNTSSGIYTYPQHVNHHSFSQPQARGAPFSVAHLGSRLASALQPVLGPIVDRLNQGFVATAPLGPYVNAPVPSGSTGAYHSVNIPQQRIPEAGNFVHRGPPTAAWENASFNSRGLRNVPPRQSSWETRLHHAAQRTAWNSLNNIPQRVQVHQTAPIATPGSQNPAPVAPSLANSGHQSRPATPSGSQADDEADNSDVESNALERDSSTGRETGTVTQGATSIVQDDTASAPAMAVNCQTDGEKTTQE